MSILVLQRVNMSPTEKLSPTEYKTVGINKKSKPEFLVFVVLHFSFLTYFLFSKCLMDFVIVIL